MDDPTSRLEAALAGPPKQWGLRSNGTPLNLADPEELGRALVQARELCRELLRQRDEARTLLAMAEGLITAGRNSSDDFRALPWWKQMWRAGEHLAHLEWLLHQ